MKGLIRKNDSIFASLFYLVSDRCEFNGLRLNACLSVGDVCNVIRSFLVFIGVERTSFSCSVPAIIFDSLDRRLTGDSRKAKTKR